MILNREQILSIEKKRKEKNKSGRLKTNSDIAKELGVSEPTVIRWVKRLREGGYQVPKRASGREKIEL